MQYFKNMTPWESLLYSHTFINITNVFYFLIDLHLCVHLLIVKPMKLFVFFFLSPKSFTIQWKNITFIKRLDVKNLN